MIPQPTLSIWGSSLAFQAPLAPITMLTKREKQIQLQPNHPGVQQGNLKITMQVVEAVFR